MSSRCCRIRVALALLLPVCLAGVQAGELEQRFQSQLKRAEAGDGPAMYAVGELYELGMGTASSRSEALRWYRAAAEQGHPQGAYQLGYAYYWGKGVSKDRTQAHSWFLRAAEAGNQAAMPYLSKMYALGQGVAQDKDKAETWAQRARIASEVNSPPPAPETRQVRTETQPQPEPEGRNQPTARPAPAPKSRPSQAPRQRTAASKPPARVVIDRLLASRWLKHDRPALFLPSARTECTDRGTQLDCHSAPRRSSLLGLPYTFRVLAEIVDFDKEAGFSIRYRPQVTAVLQAGPGAFGEDGANTITEQQLRERVERAPQELHCRFQEDRVLQCSDENGKGQAFAGVVPGEIDTAISSLPSGSVGTRVAAPPTPPQPPAEQEESRRIRTIGPRP